MGQWLSFIGLSGIFLSGLAFLYNRGYEHANRFLAIFLFLVYFCIFNQFMLGFGQSIEATAMLMSGFPSLYYLIGPAAFFYVRSILRDDLRLKRSDLLHLLPFVIMAAGTIPFLFTSWEHKLVIAERLKSDQWAWMDMRFNILLPDPVNHFLRAFHSLGYLGYILWMLFGFFRSGAADRAVEQIRLMRRWLYSLIGIALLINISYIVFLVELFLQEHHHSFLVRGTPSLTIFVLGAIAIEASILLFPHILYGLPTNPGFEPVLNFEAAIAAPGPGLMDPKPDADKWSPGQLLTKDYSAEIALKLQTYVEDGGALSPDCSIAHLSERTELPQHHLHYYFNHVEGEKFSDWKNRQRIEWVIRQISDPQNGSYTLEAIARQAGFEHRSTFVSAFRKVKGLLPRDYIKSIHPDR
jgi:AraC-like DNA-binding protein